MGRMALQRMAVGHYRLWSLIPRVSFSGEGTGMELTSRESWAVIHGLILGTIFLLVFGRPRVFRTEDLQLSYAAPWLLM